MPSMQDVVDALAAQRRAQIEASWPVSPVTGIPMRPEVAQSGPIPSVMAGTVPVMQAGEAPVYRVSEPIAGTVAMPPGARPASVGPDPGFDPLAWAARGAVDPFTGKIGMTVQEALAQPASWRSVPKVEGRPPARTSLATSDPGAPRLSPLDAPLTAEAAIDELVPALPPIAPGNFMSGFTKGDSYRLKPGQPLDVTGLPPRVLVGQDVTPIPRPRPAGSPVMMAARPAQQSVMRRPYAGEPTPSLIPHADDGMLRQLNGLSALAQSPLGQLFAMFGSGGRVSNPTGIGGPMVMGRRVMAGPRQDFTATANGGSLVGASDNYAPVSQADIDRLRKGGADLASFGYTPQWLARYGLA